LDVAIANIEAQSWKVRDRRRTAIITGGSGSHSTGSSPMRKKSRVQSFFCGDVLNEHDAILDIRYFPWATRIFFETTLQLLMMYNKLNFRNAWSGNIAGKVSKMPDELRAAAELFPEFGVCRDRKFHCFIHRFNQIKKCEHHEFMS
jgi:hypothetical protein